MNGIRCSNCSTLNRDIAKFCSKCGTKLDAYVPVPEQSWEEPSQYEPEPYYPFVDSMSPQPQPQKKGWLQITTNLIAVVSGGFSVLFICLALLILNATQILTDGDLYKESLRDQDVYNRFPDLFAEQMVRSQASLGKEARIDFTGVEQADWKYIAQELINPEWLQTQVENLIDEIFNSMDEGTEPPALRISLVDITKRLSDDAGFNIYRQVIRTKRECTLDDLFEIIFWMDEESGSVLPICNIATDLTDFIAFLGGYSNGDELIRDLIKDLPDALPDEILLSEFFTLPMESFGNFIAVWRGIAWFLLVIAVIALLATFISPIGRTLKGALLLWGIPFALAGLILLVVSFFMPIGLSYFIVSGFKGSMTANLVKILLEMGRDVSESSSSGLRLDAAIMLVVGVLMASIPIGLWGFEKFRKIR